MSAARFDDDLQPLTPGQRVRDAVGLRRQNALAELLRETAMGTHIKGGPGLRVKRGAQGVSITPRKPPPSGRTVNILPSWYPRRLDLTHISIEPGVFNDDPVITADMEVDATVLNHIYLHVSVTPTIVSAWVTSGTFTAAAVELFLAGSLPTNSNTDRYLKLFTWQAGALVDHFIKYNINMACRDDGTRTSTPAFPTWAGA